MPKHQQGVVLIVALVMLLVISLASVAVMRGAINTDTVSDNNRRQTQAMQGAQAGLRYCENQVVAGKLTPSAAVAAVASEDWKSFANWQTSAPPKQAVPASFLATDSNNAPAVAQRPECMAQFRTLGTGRVVVVTSRGFSDNYVAAPNGQTQAGSVAWLQSIVQLGGS